MAAGLYENNIIALGYMDKNTEAGLWKNEKNGC